MKATTKETKMLKSLRSKIKELKREVEFANERAEQKLTDGMSMIFTLTEDMKAGKTYQINFHNYTITAVAIGTSAVYQ